MKYNDEVYNLLEYAGKLRPEDIFYSPMQYLLKNLSSIATMSIYDLADASFVSPASISRMCRDLGYKNYQEFKISVYSAYRQAVDCMVDSNKAYSVPRGDASSFEATMVLNYLDQCRAGLDFSESFVRGEHLEKNLKLIRDADNVFVFSTTYQDVTPLQNKLILSGKYLAIFHGSIPEIEARSRKDLRNAKGDEKVCCLFLMHTQEEYPAFEPFIKSLREIGATVIMFRPMSLNIDGDCPVSDLDIPFPDVGSISDETFFSSYIACLTIAL